MKIAMRIHAICFILGIILSVTSLKAEEERLWQLHAVDIQAPYAPVFNRRCLIVLTIRILLAI